MRVYLCCIMRHVALALRCFQPTAEHSAYFSQYSLGLENLGFICDFKLQHQTQFQHRNFKHAACFDKIRGLECFRCVLRHNQMRQTFKYAVFKAETKRISPASFCMVDNIHSCLVCFLLIMVMIPIDVGLSNIWRSWFHSPKKTPPTFNHDFQYNLEKNIFELFKDLNDGKYRHGGYKKFVVSDNKRREISVASIRDRVVHRLVYDYLAPIYDKTFIYDAWSCRVGKGLLGAIERAQTFLKNHLRSYVWKGDVKKFFDSVDQKTLLKILSFKIKDERAYNLLKEIIYSFQSDVIDKAGGVGIPIGNLTSQIFANVYF